MVPQDIITLYIITNLKFQHEPKYHLSKKNPSYKNRLTTYQGAKNPLSYYTLNPKP